MHFPLLHRAFFNRFIVQSLPFPSNDPASPGSSTVRAPFPPYAPPAQAYHASRLPPSPQAVWAGCPSLLRSVRLWIIGTNVVEWNSRRVTRSTVPRFEVQVVMITLRYALAPLTGTPEPANARENLVAHEFKFEWPFEVLHALFDWERGGQLPSVLAPLEPPPVLEPAGSK
ncbi:hypothetical protein Tco_0741386 [Tanacetum coccineum]